jgi:hypothetical protein
MDFVQNEEAKQRIDDAADDECNNVGRDQHQCWTRGVKHGPQGRCTGIFPLRFLGGTRRPAPGGRLACRLFAFICRREASV